MPLLSWFELNDQMLEICDEKTRKDVVDIKKEIQQLSNFFYPVGSIYMSYDGSVTPDKLFGGRWEQITDTFLYCSDNSGNKGGKKEHTLSVEEMPVHTHTQLAHTHLQNEHNHTQNEHNHTQNEHTHTQNEHTHNQSNHTHTFGKHNHLMEHSHDYNGTINGGTNSAGNHHHVSAKYVDSVIAKGTNLPRWFSANSDVTETGHTLTSDAGEHTHSFTANYSGTTINISEQYTELGGGGETGSNSSTIDNTTATNNNTIATNNPTTAINNPVTATNQETTAINENAGGGKSFNIMPPYTTIFAWKRLSLI